MSSTSAVWAAVAVLPDSATVVTGSEDKTVKVWPAVTPGALKTFSGHQGQIYSVAWAPNGEQVATGAADKSLVLWINEYFGPVSREGKAFNQMQVYLDHEAKVLASVGIPQRSADTFGLTIRWMRERKMTFQEAIDSPEFTLIQRSRLHIVRRELFEQLEALA